MNSINAAIIAHENDYPIVVADALENPHPLTLLADRYLQKVFGAPWDRRSASRAWGSEIFLLRVHEASAPRALRIMDAFAKACEARGFELRLHKHAPFYLNRAGFVGGVGL